MTADQPQPGDEQQPETIADVFAEMSAVLGPVFRSAVADLDKAVRDANVRVIATTALGHLLAEQTDQVGPLLDKLSPPHLYRVLDASAVLMGLVVDRTPEAAHADRDVPVGAPSLDGLTAGTIMRAAYLREFGKLDELLERSTDEQLFEVHRAANDLLSVLSARRMRDTGPAS